MRKGWAYGLLAVGAIAAGFLSTADAEAANGKLSKRAVGTYLIQFEVEGLPGVTFQGLASVRADGTFSGTDTNDFGVGGGVRDSLQFGAVQATGKTTATLRTVFFSYDADGNHVSTAVTVFTTSTEDNYGTISYDFQTKFYAPAVDPLDPASTPVASRNGSGTGRKIAVE